MRRFSLKTGLSRLFSVKYNFKILNESKYPVIKSRVMLKKNEDAGVHATETFYQRTHDFRHKFQQESVMRIYFILLRTLLNVLHVLKG